MLGHLLVRVLNLSSVEEKMPVIYSIPSTEHELYKQWNWKLTPKSRGPKNGVYTGCFLLVRPLQL